ncbi:MAG: hypothetical protein U1A78_17895 [Polyangia bacterium]
MSLRTTLLGLVALSAACGQPAGLAELDGTDGRAGTDEAAVATAARALSTRAQQALDWANGWFLDVDGHPEKLAENEYTASSPTLVRAGAGVLASNRSVCGTLVTMLIQNSTGLTSSDFYKSFNKAMDGTCDVGTVGGVQKGTTSPSAAQYLYKISQCAATGPIKFTAHTTIGAIEAGDVLVVSFPERTDISGHVMVVRAAPVADTSLPAGPSGSTAYAVEVIDSTQTPHGTSATYPDWRGGGTGEGLGHGTFILYASATGALVASRWSATDPDLFDSSAHPLAAGGLQ